MRFNNLTRDENDRIEMLTENGFVDATGLPVISPTRMGRYTAGNWLIADASCWASENQRILVVIFIGGCRRIFIGSCLGSDGPSQDQRALLGLVCPEQLEPAILTDLLLQDGQINLDFVLRRLADPFCEPADAGGQPHLTERHGPIGCRD